MMVTVLGADVLLSELDNLFRSVATPPGWLMEAYKALLTSEGGLGPDASFSWSLSPRSPRNYCFAA